MVESNGGLLLVEVYCDLDSAKKPGSYVRLLNSGPEPLILSHYQLEWGGHLLRFPEGDSVAAGGSIYVAQDATGFRQNLTRLPDYALSPLPGIPRLMGAGKRPPALDRAGGAVRVFTGEGVVVDAFYWGSKPAGEGWEGPGAVAVIDRTVYRRSIREETLSAESSGSFVASGGKADAWWQGTDWIPRRLMRLGQTCFPYPTFECESAVAFAAPDSAYDALSTFIESATRQIDINMYLLTNDELVDKLEAAARRGVKIRLLLEGDPYQGIPADGQRRIENLGKVGAQLRILRASNDGFKRYNLTHAKYAVADTHFSLIMSDNWTYTSAPTSPRTGNRGWGVILESTELATYLTSVLEFDWNPLSPDTVALTHGVMLPVPAGGQWLEMAARPLPEPVESIRVAGPIAATPVLGPDHALLENHGICGMMRDATRTLEIQQLTAQLFWGFDEAGSMQETPNLFLTELVAAARRGVKVRILIGGRYLEPEDKRDNSHTATYLRNLAEKERLPLQARILDYDATGMNLHNKGIIADGQSVLISSINWSENSPLYNREMGVILNHKLLADYFGRLFERDWQGGTAQTPFIDVVTRR